MIKDFGRRSTGWLRRGSSRIRCIALHLHDFAFDEIGEYGSDEFDDLVGTESTERDGSASEEKVAGENGDFVAELRGSRGS